MDVCRQMEDLVNTSGCGASLSNHGARILELQCNASIPGTGLSAANLPVATVAAQSRKVGHDTRIQQLNGVLHNLVTTKTEVCPCQLISAFTGAVRTWKGE
jgi:hypothetical protein